MYTKVSDLVEQAEKKPLHQIILENEEKLTGMSQEQLMQQIQDRWKVMCASATKALDEPQEMVGNLIQGQANQQHIYSEKITYLGKELNKMMAMAFSSSEVNASMGRICAAPTAGACGILPAVIITAAKRVQAGEKQILEALIVASGIGAVITKNATVSGAEGGCQAECGVAAAMAAAATVYLAKGTAQMCAEACAIALMNCMGLICDPVAGLVQLPCSFRNASQSINAISSADMALAGQSAIIPVDEVIESMYKVGKKLPIEFRETALGGIAATAKGKEIAESIF